MGCVMDQSHDKSRRKFVVAVGYIAPAIMTLKAVPAFAGVGSGRGGNGNGRRDRDRDRDRGRGNDWRLPERNRRR